MELKANFMMYTPSFNSVLVEIDIEDDKWGRGNDDSMLGKSYSKGKVVSCGVMLETKEYPALPLENPYATGNSITWNEGTEAGTLFEDDGKLYGFIYWWDVRGVVA